MSESKALAVQDKPRASVALAAFLGMAPDAMIDVLKAQCFKCRPADVTDGQMAAFVSIANEMQVNPLLPGMLYAFPIQGGGIVPMMGPDGVFKKLAEHPDIDSWETIVYPEDVKLPPTHATSFIYMKGRSKPLTKTCLLSEWKMTSNPNWQTRPRHMLEMRTLKQNARQAIHGIPFDDDERRMMDELNVTGTGDQQAGVASGAATTAETAAKRSEPPPRSRKASGANAIQPKTDPKADAVDITATTPADPKPAEQTELKVDQTTAPAPDDGKTIEPRTELKDKERIEVMVTVREATAAMVKVAGVPTPSVLGKVEGGYNGSVYHFGGATVDGDTMKPTSPAWNPGSYARISLLGRLNNNTQKVMVIAESITLEANPSEGSDETVVD